MKHTHSSLNLELFTHLKENSEKGFAVLIDPDKAATAYLCRLIPQAVAAGAFCIFVGGSLLSTQQLEDTLAQLRELTDLPLILFPGSVQQVSARADAILFLSLISGRNPEFLIGSQVVAAPAIRAAGIEAIPTGYMLIDGGAPTTASYISNTQPIPGNKPDIAACTALAGELLGLRLLYLDTGSGAPKGVSPAIIKAVRQTTQLPIVVGGGIRTAEAAQAAWQAGADIVVVGNALEEDPSFAKALGEACKLANSAGETGLVTAEANRPKGEKAHVG